jgi:hypothetical protein
MVALDHQVVEWIERTFERTREPSEPSISIEQGTASLLPPRPSPPRAHEPAPTVPPAGAPSPDPARGHPQRNLVPRIELEKTTVRPSQIELEDRPTVLRPAPSADDFDETAATTIEARAVGRPSPPPRVVAPPETVAGHRPRVSPPPELVSPAPPAVRPLATDALPNPRSHAPSRPPIPIQPSDSLRSGSPSSPPPLQPAAPPVAPAIPMADPRERGWGIWIALAVLIVAVAAGVVVYFAWPYPP